MFCGWTTNPIGGTDTTEPTYVTSATMSTSDISYYAVYAKATEITEAKEFSFTITEDDFNAKSYDANNGSHDFTATCTADNTKQMTVACTTYQVMLQSSVMQWQSGKGYIYNTTDLGKIKSVKVNSSAGTFTTYYGTSEHPTSGTTVGNGFFTVKVGGATGKTSSVVVTFERNVQVTTYSDYCTTLTSANITISKAGWATACVPFNATVTGAEAYYVTVEGDKLTKTEAKVIPAGAGVLLKGEEGVATTATFTSSTDDADNTDDNMMLGSLYGETFSKTDYTYYILANDTENGIGFYYQGENNKEGKTAKCDAGKAVLAVPTSVGAKSFFSLFDEADGIKEINNVQKQDAQYNLSGVRVNGNYKGIVIINGKKVLK